MKKLIPLSILKWLRPKYHGLKAYSAAWRYGFPAKNLKTIGITGTKGKTTTTVFTGRLLNLYGLKTGYITTAVINLGDDKGEFLNPYKMTTIDPVILQRYLSQMVLNGCQYVVLEMSSQGLEQNRHLGVKGFDAAVFLNITPEHIEAHGGWEQYKQAKGILFSNIKPRGIFIGNKDFEETRFMWEQVPPKMHSQIQKLLVSPKSDIQIKNGVGSLYKSLTIDKVTYPTQLVADFDVVNCYFALTTIAGLLGKNPKRRQQLMSKLATHVYEMKSVPGRMEWVVREGKIAYGSDNPRISKTLRNISILVDYAHEPESMKQLLTTLASWKKKGYFETIIHIISCDGAGRDDWKKPILGDLSRKFADVSVITTDNYEAGDKPEDIVNLLAKSFQNQELDKKYFIESDRYLALQKALNIASGSSKKTLIVSTGVGSEQGLTHPNGKLDWDEREKWLEVVIG